MTKALLYTFLLSVVVFSYVATAGETYYRWTDERGNLLHSDRPPPKGTDYEVVSTDSNDIRKVDGSKGAVPLEVNPRVGNEFDTYPKEPKDFKRSPETCRRAKENMASLNSGEVIRMRNDQGEIRELSADDIAYQKQRAEEVMRAHCD
jgi:Domain of unknown function (DUF4124)